MQCIKTTFVVEIVSFFLDVLFKSPKFISILQIPPDNSIISVKLHFVECWFL